MAGDKKEAGQAASNDQVDPEKLKELERDLALELDQQINLSEPVDSVIGGSVDLNPKLNTEVPAPKKASTQAPGEEASAPTAAVAPGESANKGQATPGEAKTYESIPKERAPEPPAEAPQKSAADAQEISLEDLDSLLATEAPDLKAEIESLKAAGEDPNAKGADLSETDVDESAAEGHAEGSEDLPRRLSFRELAVLKVKGAINWSLDFLYQAPIKGFRYLVKFMKEDLKNTAAGVFQIFKYRIGRAIRFVADLKLPQKLALVGMILVLIGIGALLRMPNLQIQLGFKFHPGFAHAHYDEVYTVAEGELVPLSEAGEYPQFVVLLDKVVVNLQPSENSTRNPMVAMRLYFESNTRQGAIEIKDREKEARDLTQRVLETFTYDQIVSARGKLEFKEQLRRELTAIMNTGIVKNVYIDEILIKP